MQALELKEEAINEESIESKTWDSPVPSVDPLLQLKGLTVEIKHKQGAIAIIRDLSLAIRPGETVALVGESGSGKSVTAGAILGLLPKSMQVTAGQIIFQGEDLVPRPPRLRRKLCGSRIACVFQDYQGSFTPFMRIGTQMVETIRSHGKLSVRQAKEMALESLDRVDLPAQRAFDSYPFQLSGGQLQRAAIALAMLLQPALLIADEPTTALDALNGELVLDLLDRMKRRIGCSVLFISHDLHHVMKRADGIAVMRSGVIVEKGEAAAVHQSPKHPYTRMLLNAKPLLSEIPSGFNPEGGEPFLEFLHGTEEEQE